MQGRSSKNGAKPQWLSGVYDKLDYPNPFFSWSNANGNKKVTVLKGDKHCWSPRMELPAQWL